MDEPILKIRVRGQPSSTLPINALEAKNEVLENYLQTVSPPFHRVVDLLGKRSLVDAKASASNAEIARIDKSRSLNRQHVKDTIEAIRASLQTFNKTQTRSPYHLRIDTVPLKEMPKRTDRTQPYRLVFVERNSAQTAVALWQQLFSGRTEDIRLLYDTEDVESRRPDFKRSGQFSGSGLVAAAAFVSHMIARIEPQRAIRPLRYIDIGWGTSMDRSDTCRIALGPVSSQFEQYDFRCLFGIEGKNNFSFERDYGVAGPDERYTHVIRQSPTPHHPKVRQTSYETKRDEIGIEYAVISYFDTDTRTVVGLEGMSSVSTLAAALLMWDKRTSAILRELFKAQGISMDLKLPSFELLVKVKVSKKETMEYVDIQRLIPHPEISRQSD